MKKTTGYTDIKGNIHATHREAAIAELVILSTPKGTSTSGMRRDQAAALYANKDKVLETLFSDN